MAVDLDVCMVTLELFCPAAAAASAAAATITTTNSNVNSNDGDFYNVNSKEHCGRSVPARGQAVRLSQADSTLDFSLLPSWNCTQYGLVPPFPVAVDAEPGLLGVDRLQMFFSRNPIVHPASAATMWSLKAVLSLNSFLLFLHLLLFCCIL